MGRHTGWLRWRIAEDTPPEVADRMKPAGRKLLGALMNQLALSGNRQGLMRQTLPDGSQLTARFDGTTPIVEIVASEAALEAEEDTSNLWLPRGFVVYPLTVDHPYGVGLPVVPVGEDTPYARANMDPGLDWARWTDDGALGELLLSRDRDAGYPDATEARETAPLLYHPTRGPTFAWPGADGRYDTRPYKAPWTAYRISFQAPTGAGRAMFERCNAHRQSVGVDPLQPWPRGAYRVGQVTAEILARNGLAHHSRAFPPTYQTSYEREAKDGYPYDMSIGVNTAPSYTAPLPGEPDPYPSWFTIADYGRAHVYGGSENIATAEDESDAFDQWLGSAPHKANIEGGNWNGDRTFFDGGVRGGTFVQGFARRSNWIAAGNGQFHSDRAEIPPLTWHTFAGMNLAWETWPIGWDGEHLTKSADFTVAGGGGCWLAYLRTPAVDDTDADNPCDKQVPALGRHLYMRGRAIALAPRGGLVLGAGILRRPSVEDRDDIDRVIVLVHHPEDQPSDWKEGMTRYLRVWYADVVVRDLLVDPDQTICGEASDTYNTLPWRGGELVDVGVMPDAPIPDLETEDTNALKYSALWRFARDGSKAVALRDFSSVAQYEDRFAGTTETTLYYGGYPRAVVLSFSEASDGALVVVQSWAPWAEGDYRTAASIPGVLTPEGTAISEHNPVPLAADFDDAGTVIYAFYGDYQFTGPDLLPVTVRCMGVGDITTRGPSDFSYYVLASTDVGLPEIDFRGTTGIGVVADVRTGGFAIDGTRPRFRYPAGWTTSSAGSGANPNYVKCKAFTTEAVHGLRLFQAGSLLDEAWYACEDGAVIELWDLCDGSTAGTPTHYLMDLPSSASAMVQCWHAQRGDDWVLCAQLSPQPGLVLVRDNDDPDNAGVHHCDCQTSYDDYATRTHLMASTELAPRGGLVQSSFPLPAGADAGWFFYARAV